MKYSAAKFISLKKEIDKELARRDNTTDKIHLGAGATPFETTPAEGVRVRTEHVNKLVAPLQKINKAGLPPTVSEGERLIDISSVESRLNTLKAVNKSAASTGCSGGCAGLCRSSCFEGCKSNCGGGCEGG